MGYYIQMGRRPGSASLAADFVEARLNRQSWLQPMTAFEPDRIDEWALSRGLLRLLRKPASDGAFSAPWLECRVSWGCDESEIRATLLNLFTLATDLAMTLSADSLEGPREVNLQNLDEIVEAFCKGQGWAIGVIGKAST